MGWREGLAKAMGYPLNVGGMDDRVHLVVSAALALSAADRIALARELLAGTGRVVAVVPRRAPSSVECPTDPEGEALLRAQFGGWNLCRAAMLIDDTAREGNA